MSPIRIDQRHLPYVGFLDLRSVSDIDLLVIHCTELPDLAAAREYGEKILHVASGTGNSGHFYLDRDGHIEQWVPLDRVAHHVRGYNEHSIGIEMVNRGRYPHWLNSSAQEMTEPYPTAQLDSLLSLLIHLLDHYPQLHWIAGHEHLDSGKVPASDNPALQVYRKRDPGPQFPWDRLFEAPAIGGRLHPYTQ